MISFIRAQYVLAHWKTDFISRSLFRGIAPFYYIRLVNVNGTRPDGWLSEALKQAGKALGKAAQWLAGKPPTFKWEVVRTLSPRIKAGIRSNFGGSVKVTQFLIVVLQFVIYRVLLSYVRVWCWCCFSVCCVRFLVYLIVKFVVYNVCDFYCICVQWNSGFRLHTALFRYISLGLARRSWTEITHVRLWDLHKTLNCKLLGLCEIELAANNVMNLISWNHVVIHGKIYF